LVTPRNSALLSLFQNDLTIASQRLSVYHPPSQHLIFSYMTTSKTTRKANPALMKPVQPDSALAAIVGSTPLPRSEMTKKLWDYIKKNGLQDEKNKRNINADAALKEVFGGKSQVTMFEMTKLVNQHVK
jgi:chromatin remodeling complex protein RSC6